MKWNERRWKRSVGEFGQFMEPLVAELGRSERREGAVLYVEGLLTPGQRKSVEPMAARLQVDYQKRQQFITDSPWEDDQVWTAIRREVVPVMEPLEAWIIDETGWVKQGNKSVGVSHQYCGSVGKQANCQVSVHVTVSKGEVTLPIGGRLYLPESWTSDRDRCVEAGVPETVEFLSKPEIALELIKQALADGVPRAPVLGDSVYGDGGPMRRALRKLDMEYFFQVEERLLAWTRPVKIEQSRKHWRVAEGQAAPLTVRAIAGRIPPQEWKSSRWKDANDEKQTTRIAWLPIYLRRLAGRQHPQDGQRWQRRVRGRPGWRRMLRPRVVGKAIGLRCVSVGPADRLRAGFGQRRRDGHLGADRRRGAHPDHHAGSADGE